MWMRVKEVWVWREGVGVRVYSMTYSSAADASCSTSPPFM